MTFYTFDDFYKKRLSIKVLFTYLDKNAKRFYMWYLYSNTHMSLTKKNALWDYLNDYKTDEDLYLIKLGLED